MQISAKVSAIFAIVFAGICLWFAIDGWTSPADVSDPEQTSGGRDFALIWGFLAVVGFVIGLVSWTIGQSPADKDH